MENKLRICIYGSTLIFVDFVAPHSCIYNKYLSYDNVFTILFFSGAE